MPHARVTLAARAVALTLGLTLATTLAACSAPGGGAPDGASSSGAQAPGASASPGDEPESATPLTVARQVLVSWSRPDVGYSRWWSDLEPLLSAGARQTYAYTDPAAVPALDLPRVGELTEGPLPGTATVRFETPDGAYGVDLARAGGKGPWRAERILFPHQSSLYAE